MGVSRAVFLAFAIAIAGCHGAEVHDRVPLAVRLGAFHSATFVVAGGSLDADDVKSFREELVTRVTDAKLFAQVVPPGAVAELMIRVTLLSESDDGAVEVSFAVELFDVRQQHKLVGRFDVDADSRSGGGFSMGSGVNIDFDSKTTKALEKAASAIVAHLEEVSSG